jgi:hypothetical protein
LLKDLIHRYDGDNDTIPGAPVVTWADFQLAEIANFLLEFVIEQSKEINQLNARLEKLENSIRAVPHE